MIRTKVAHVTTIDMSLRYLLLNQLRIIQQIGYEVTGISSPGPEVPFIEAANIRHVPVSMTRNPFTPLQDLKALWQLYHIFRREHFAIVHTHNPKPGFLGQIAAKMAGVPIIVNTLHGFYFHDHMHPALRRFFVTLEKIAARCSDVILSQNREDIQTAIREHICPPEKIKHLGNGIDVRRFDRERLAPEALAQTRSGLGLPPGAPVVGFVGRLVEEKGILELLQAARLVREHIPAARFLIVGPVDSEKPDTFRPESAGQYGLADACIFTGMRQDMPELYALMDVFVLPSHREGSPRAPMEASAMGVPCVVTDIRGCRETVEHNRNGLLVPLGNVEALAKAILELLTDREKARRLGEGGRCMALERFDERMVFEKVKAEYTRLLQEKDFSPPTPTRKIAAADDGPMTKCPMTAYCTSGKRLLDLVFTIPALILLAPLLGMLAILVRLKLGKPVLFRQQRPGLDGQPFILLKFRTMADAQDAQGNPLPDAGRLTPFGRFLRCTSLDELPELFNVLKGDMSLVGPRPLLMQYLERYTPEQMRRHEVRPGITGWAQVNGRNTLTWEQKFALDVWYVDHQSLWLDLKIIALTAWKTLKREGISQPGHVTMEEFKGHPANPL